MTDEERKAFYRKQYQKKKKRMIAEGTWAEYIKKRKAYDNARPRTQKQKAKKRNTNNAYMKRRLVRLKEDPEAYAEYLRKRRGYDKKRRADLKANDPVRYAAQQVRRRASEKRSRDKRAERDTEDT
jgi:hypothetical protein